MGKQSRKKKMKRQQEDSDKRTILERIVKLVREANLPKVHKETGATVEESSDEVFYSMYGFPKRFLPIDGGTTGTDYDQAFVIDAQNVSNWFWEHDQVNWDHSEFNAAPIFKNVWIEWRDANARNMNTFTIQMKKEESFCRGVNMISLERPKDGMTLENVVGWLDAVSWPHKFLPEMTEAGLEKNPSKAALMKVMMGDEWRWFTQSTIFVAEPDPKTLPKMIGRAYHLTNSEGKLLASSWSLEPWFCDDQGIDIYDTGRFIRLEAVLREKVNAGDLKSAEEIENFIKANSPSWTVADMRASTIVNWMLEWHCIPLLSHTFSHCANKVKIIQDPFWVPRKPKPRPAGASLLYRDPAEDFNPRPHIIKIDPLKDEIRRRTGSTSLNSRDALTIVKGHFVRYGIEGRGFLFGDPSKPRGLFYIASHERGSDASKFRQPTYRVEI